jgi:MraZ protein
MQRFRGYFEYSVDEKGRLNIPAKFRKVVSPEADETFVIVRGPNNCLQAFPQDGWSVFETELDKRPTTPGTVKFKRHLYGSLSDSQLDGQGRITLSPQQLAVAGISKKAIMVGHGNYLEIWSPEKYQEYVGSGDDFDNVYFQSVQDSLKTP